MNGGRHPMGIGNAAPYRAQVELLMRRLREAEGPLQALAAGEVDAVVDPATAVPILLSHAQQALAHSEARHRDLIARCPSVVCELAADGTTLFVNDALRTVAGLAPDALVGRDWWTSVVPQEWRERAEELARQLRRGDVTAVELPLLSRDGSCRWIEWTSANRYDDDGALEAAVLFGLDVTARRDAEESGRRLTEERLARTAAEAASQAKSEFLATMSHELRTPVNAILGYAELLEMGIAGAPSEGQRQYLERIRASGAHLAGLVGEVLDLAKVESGRLVLTPGRARAGDAVSASIGLVGPQAAARGIALTDACNGSGELAYVGDEARVRQVLVNLLANAVKFTPSGGRIVVRCEATDQPPPSARLGRGPWTVLRVEDSGIGIASDRLEQVFEAFVQIDGGHTRKEGGTGLGLTISRRLARLMGGDLTAASAPGRGSTFSLWLPTPAGASAGAPAEGSSGEEADVVRHPALGEIGERLARQAEDVAAAVAARLRGDDAVPRAAAASRTELMDHIGTFVADLGKSLLVLAEHAGEPSRMMRDGTDIQRVIAERHGAQRARLGWDERAIAREHEILSEELESAVRRVAGVGAPEAAEALGLLRLFVEQAERVARRGMHAAAATAAMAASAPVAAATAASETEP